MHETKQIKPLPCGAYAKTVSILFLQLTISLLIDLRNIAYRSIRGKALFIDGNERSTEPGISALHILLSISDFLLALWFLEHTDWLSTLLRSTTIYCQGDDERNHSL